MGDRLNSSFVKFQGLLLLFSLCTAIAWGQKKGEIEILNARVLYGIEKNGQSAQRLVGDVQFRHKGTIMYCDSADFYSKSNSLDAFGSVRIKKEQSLNLYGDFLHYDGNIDLATVTGKEVRLVTEDFNLITDRLLYSIAQDIASYSTGAVIRSTTENTVLESVRGDFNMGRSLFLFKKNVVLTNPEYVVKSDTLHYNTLSEVVTFLGPTTITGDDNLIYCENGWYDTKVDQSRYYSNAYILTDGKRLQGDTLYYDRNTGFGKVDGNVQIIDTAENLLVTGGHARLFEKKDSAIVTDESLLMQVFDMDTLFMHADTFKVYRTEEGAQFLFAYYGVKIFKNDLQGSCDSISYSLSDSTIKLYYNPVLWTLENQLTADSISIRTKNNKIHSLYLDKNAFIISRIDQLRYNQIKGKNMIGYFKEGKLKTINVTGNGQTTYYGQDEANKFIGVNVAESANIRIVLGEKSIETITFLRKPKATMHPMGALDPVTELRYKGFKWLGKLRPTNRESLFKDDRAPH